MSRTRIVAIAIVVALAIVAYGGWWLHAARLVHRAIDTWAEAQRAQGLQVELADVAVQGFPLRLEAVASRFAVGRDVPLRWRWAGPRLTASVPPWGSHEVQVSFPGAHTIEFDARDGPKAIALKADKADGTVHIADGGKIALVTVALGPTQADLPDLGPTSLAKLDLSIGATTTPVAPSANDPRAHEVGRIAVAADDIQLPERAASTLGRRIAHTELELVLRGAIPAAQTEAALAAWRDAGGTVELTKLRLHWGELQAEADGSAALDDALQPQGALTVRAWGVESAIDALVAGGAVRPREGAITKTVLHAMAKPGTASGIPPEVEIPLTIQDRKLFLGPVPVARIPIVVWPSTSR
jgi:hypothetical protein